MVHFIGLCLLNEVLCYSKSGCLKSTLCLALFSVPCEYAMWVSGVGELAGNPLTPASRDSLHLLFLLSFLWQEFQVGRAPVLVTPTAELQMITHSGVVLTEEKG
jgi:hypothetical protein